jgi:hypothetical protein
MATKPPTPPAHTAGPWKLEKLPLSAEFTIIGSPICLIGGEENYEPDDAGRYVVGTVGDYGEHGAEVCKANAHLIAAAPELLSALKCVLEDYIGAMSSEYDYPSDPWIDRAAKGGGGKEYVKEIRSIIAKAEGRA